MTRLIDADRLKAEMSTWGMNDYEPLDFIEAIDAAPTVIECKCCKYMGNERECRDCYDYSNFVQFPTISDRPQGFWDISPETEVIAGIEIPAIFRERFCSVCRAEAFYDQGFGYVLSQYCPQCGARLIQEDKDNEQAK